MTGVLALAQPARPDRGGRGRAAGRPPRLRRRAARPPTACASRCSASRAIRPTSSSPGPTSASTWATTSPTPARSPRRSRARCSGLPAVALSQAGAADGGVRRLGARPLRRAPRAAARLGRAAARRRHQRQRPGGRGAGVRVAQLGRRRYRPQLRPAGEAEGGRRHYRLYGDGLAASRRRARDRHRRRRPTAASRSRRCASTSSPRIALAALQRAASGGRMSYTTVIFDLDGTLIDTVPLIVASHRHALATVLGRELPEEALREGIGRPLLEQMRVFDEERAQELFDVYREFNHRVHDEYVTRVPGHARAVRRPARARRPGRGRHVEDARRRRARRTASCPGWRSASTRWSRSRRRPRTSPDPSRSEHALELLGRPQRAPSTSATPPATCRRRAPPAWPRSGSPGVRSTLRGSRGRASRCHRDDAGRAR